MKKPSIVVVISGNGSNLQALIDAIAAGKLTAELSAVISNRPNAFGLERAEKAGIKTSVVDHTQYSDRKAFDRAMMDAIDHYHPDLVVLAGFMRILTDEFVTHYQGRMLNVHPSLLPKFRGLNTHQRAIEEGEREHGVTIHFVTPELDGGPLIIHAKTPIEASDDASSLAAKIQQLEHKIYPLAVEWFVSGRLKLEGDHAVLDGAPIQGVLDYAQLA